MQASKADDTNGGRNIMQLNGLNGFALTIYFRWKMTMLTWRESLLCTEVLAFFFKYVLISNKQLSVDQEDQGNIFGLRVNG